MFQFNPYVSLATIISWIRKTAQATIFYFNESLNAFNFNKKMRGRFFVKTLLYNCNNNLTIRKDLLSHSCCFQVWSASTHKHVCYCRNKGKLLLSSFSDMICKFKTNLTRLIKSFYRQNVCFYAKQQIVQSY